MMNWIDITAESLNASSTNGGPNGTASLDEDLKETTLNMQVPASLSRKTKTQAESYPSV